MVDGTGLENRQGCKLLVGSNPTPSANSPTAAPAHFNDYGAVELLSDPEPMRDEDTAGT